MQFGHHAIKEPILVGGKKFIVIPSNEIKDIFQFRLDATDYLGMSCRSLLYLHHGVNGRLYRTGEYILATVNTSNGDVEQVIQVVQFFSLNVNGQHFIFVKGQLFVNTFDEQYHIYSSNPFVIPSSSMVVVLASNVLCKVMLYPHPDNLHSIYCH